MIRPCTPWRRLHDEPIGEDTEHATLKRDTQVAAFLKGSGDILKDSLVVGARRPAEPVKRRVRVIERDEVIAWTKQRSELRQRTNLRQRLVGFLSKLLQRELEELFRLVND